MFLLDEAEHWLDRGATDTPDTRLAGLTLINALFENSTRTLLSFEIARETPGRGRGQHAPAPSM